MVLKCDYFPAVEAKSSTTKVCERLRKNSIPFDSAALAPERPSPRTDCGEARNLPSHEWKPKPRKWRVEGLSVRARWPLVVLQVVQSTSLITTLGGASKRCPYSRSVVIPEVSLYVSQWDGTLRWAWKFCRYSRIVVISEVVISEVDCIWVEGENKCAGETLRSPQAWCVLATVEVSLVPIWTLHQPWLWAAVSRLGLRPET